MIDIEKSVKNLNIEKNALKFENNNLKEILNKSNTKNIE